MWYDLGRFLFKKKKKCPKDACLFKASAFKTEDSCVHKIYETDTLFGGEKNPKHLKAVFLLKNESECQKLKLKKKSLRPSGKVTGTR